MKSIGYRLLGIFVVVFCVLGGFSLLALNASMTPDGVRSKAQLIAYKKKMDQLLTEQERREQGLNFPKAKAVVVQSDHDFGMLDPHTTATYAFEIQNLGEADLFLKAGETSCKCTVGTLGAETVPPGYSTKVTLEWNTGNQIEDYKQTALVHTNDPDNPTLELTVHGKVKTELSLADAALTFPATDLSKEVQVSTYVYSQLWDEFIVESVTADIPGFQWSVEPVPEIEMPLGNLQAKSAWKLKVSAFPTTSAPYSGSLKLVAVPIAGGEPIERELTLSGKVRNRISFQDPEIHDQKGLELGIMSTGREHRRSVIVRVRGELSGPLQVLDVKPDQMRAELRETGVKGTYRLTVIAPKDATTKIFNLAKSFGYVHVGLPDDRAVSAWLPLSGAIVPPPSSSGR
jgi:hypothetical protein